jgi:conjugal transfer pilus assembly protein TraW
MKGKVFAMLMCGLFTFPASVYPASSQDALGPSYPITEPDMLEEIQARLKSMEKDGRMGQLKKEAIERSKQSIERPDAVKGIVKTRQARTFYFDPSWRVPRDITAPDGQVIARAGDVVNPLDYVPLSNHLLFFDQSDPKQVKKAAEILIRFNGAVKPILVAGEPLKLTRLWKRQVYFDQSGHLVRRFGITQVPALVSQDPSRKRLRIDELEAE